MDSQIKKVPWANWEEWLDCWELLKSSPSQALEILEVWSHIQQLPVRVEATRILLRCLQDLTPTGSTHEVASIKSETSRLALSMAVVRCTNLIIDTYNDCKFARSVGQTAKSIKLPEFIVDLRHDATHSSLPSSFLLSKAFAALFAWLLDNYWEKQAEVLASSKCEKILSDIERFEKRAKNISDHYSLAKFAEGLFADRVVFKERTGKYVAELRWKMDDDSWAMLFLGIRAKNQKFPESTLQGVLALAKEGKISYEQGKVAVQEIIALAGSVRVSYTPAVKHLMRMQNEDQNAYKTVKILLESQAFDQETSEIVQKMHNVTIFSNSTSEPCEILQLPMKRWRSLQSWSTRPIGSYSVFT